MWQWQARAELSEEALIRPSGEGTSGWQSREAEKESGFVPLLLHTHPGTFLPSDGLHPIESVESR